MNRYHRSLLFRIICVVVLTALTSGLILYHYYWIGAGLALCLVYSVYRLFLFQQRTVKDMQRLISAIRFSEFNISFNKNVERGLAPELITEMERSVMLFDQRLRDSEMQQNFYDTLLNRIDFGIVVVDKAHNIQWINKPAVDVFGKPQPRTLQDLKRTDESLPALLEQLLPRETRIIRLNYNNKLNQLAISAVYFTMQGKELKLISLKNIQTVLEESETEAWKKLIRVLTHEIMNSITPIISLAETFSEFNEENKDMITKAMQTIHRRSEGLVNFVHNYQQLTRIPPPVISEFSATDLMDDIRNLLLSNACRFDYTIQPDTLVLAADRSQMEQVMINLIRNACEAIPAGENPEVHVAFSLDEYQRPVISVADKGEGILPDVLDKIFVPFFTTKSTGSGIGLSICRQIINLHGGTIEVDSLSGSGTVFTIRL